MGSCSIIRFQLFDELRDRVVGGKAAFTWGKGAFKVPLAMIADVKPVEIDVCVVFGRYCSDGVLPRGGCDSRAEETLNTAGGWVSRIDPEVEHEAFIGSFWARVLWSSNLCCDGGVEDW